MIEASNMLLVPGASHRSAREKAENPKIELPPERIETMVNADRAQWATLAHGLHDRRECRAEGDRRERARPRCSIRETALIAPARTAISNIQYPAGFGCQIEVSAASR